MFVGDSLFDDVETQKEDGADAPIPESDDEFSDEFNDDEEGHGD